MRNKEEYISEEIKKIIDNKKISGRYRKIEKLKKLSNEDYYKILKNEELEQKEQIEFNNKLIDVCDKLGLTLDEFDNL